MSFQTSDDLLPPPDGGDGFQTTDDSSPPSDPGVPYNGGGDQSSNNNYGNYGDGSDGFQTSDQIALAADPGVQLDTSTDDQKKQQQSFSIDPGVPVAADPGTPLETQDAPAPVDHGNFFNRVADLGKNALDEAGKVVTLPERAIYRSVADDGNNPLSDPGSFIKDAYGEAAGGVASVASDFNDVGKRAMASTALSVADFAHDPSIKGAIDVATPQKNLYSDLTGEGNPWDSQNTVDARNVLEPNPLSAILPGTAGNGDQGVYDVPVVGGLARAGTALVGGALGGDYNPSIDTGAVRRELAQGQSVAQVQQENPGSKGYSVLGDIANPVNYVEIPGVAEAIHEIFTPATQKAVGEVGDKLARSGDWAPQAGSELTDAVKAGGVNPLDMSNPNKAQAATNMQVAYTPGASDIASAPQALATLYDGASLLAKGEDATGYADAIANTYGGTVAGNLDHMRTLVEGVQPDVQPLRTLIGGTADTGEATATKLAQKADALRTGNIPTDDFVRAAEKRGVDLSNPAAINPQDLAAVRAQAARDIYASDIREAWYARAGAKLPEDAGALQKGMQGLASVTRGLLLAASAPPLALQKFTDEYFRAATQGTLGIRLADTNIGQAVSRFGEKNNLLGRGDAFRSFGDQGTVRGLQAQGRLAPDAFLKSTKSDTTIGSLLSGKDRYGNKIGLGKQLAQTYEAPGRALAKWNDSLISAPTKHVVLNAARQDTQRIIEMRANLASHVQADVFARTGDHVAAQEAGDIIRSASNRADILAAANRIDAATGRAAIGAPEPGAIDPHLMDAIGRTGGRDLGQVAESQRTGSGAVRRDIFGTDKGAGNGSGEFVQSILDQHVPGTMDDVAAHLASTRTAEQQAAVKDAALARQNGVAPSPLPNGRPVAETGPTSLNGRIATLNGELHGQVVVRGDTQYRVSAVNTFGKVRYRIEESPVGAEAWTGDRQLIAGRQMHQDNIGGVSNGAKRGATFNSVDDAFAHIGRYGDAPTLSDATRAATVAPAVEPLGGVPVAPSLTGSAATDQAAVKDAALARQNGNGATAETYATGGARKPNAVGEGKSYPTGMSAEEINVKYGGYIKSAMDGKIPIGNVIDGALKTDDPLAELARYRQSAARQSRTVTAERYNAFKGELDKAATEYRNGGNGAAPPEAALSAAPADPGVPVEPPPEAAPPPQELAPASQRPSEAFPVDAAPPVPPSSDPGVAVETPNPQAGIPTDILRKASAEYEQIAHGQVQKGLERGYRIVGNNGDQTALGATLKNGLGGVTPPVLPFAPFHVHSTQFWASYFASHPAMAVSMAQVLSNLDDYGTLHFPGGATVNGLVKATTGLHLLDWVRKAYGYDQAVAQQGQNNPFQRVLKDVGYNVFGNNAFVRPFDYISGPATSLVQDFTNPLMSGKKDFNTGAPLVDPRDQMTEYGAMAGTTGLGETINDKTGGRGNRGLIQDLTNPGQWLGNQLEKVTDNLPGLSIDRTPYTPEKAEAHALGLVTDQMGLTKYAAEKAYYNPQTPAEIALGKQLHDAVHLSMDTAATGKLAPIQVNPAETPLQAKGVFQPAKGSSYELDHPISGDFTVRDFLSQPGNLFDLDAQLREATASGDKQKQKDIEIAIARVKASDLTTHPEVKGYLDASKAQTIATFGDTSFRGGLKPNEQNAYDAFNDLKASPDYKARTALETQAAAVASGKDAPKGSAEHNAYTAFYKANGDELTRLNNIVNGAEQSIVNRYQVNPKELANRAAEAAGYKPTYDNTTIPGPVAPFVSNSGGGGGSSSNAPRTSRSAPRATFSTNRNNQSKGTSSATTEALSAKADFYAQYNAIKADSTKTAAAVRADPAVQNVLQGLHSAAEWQAATAKAKEIAAKTDQKGINKSANNVSAATNPVTFSGPGFGPADIKRLMDTGILYGSGYAPNGAPAPAGSASASGTKTPPQSKAPTAAAPKVDSHGAPIRNVAAYEAAVAKNKKVA